MTTTAHHRHQRPTAHHRWAARGTALLAASALLVTLGLGTESAAEATPSTSVAVPKTAVATITAPTARATGNVRGQIESDKAVPASRVAVVVHTADRRRIVASFKASSNGKYSIKGLKPGRYRMTITPGKKAQEMLARKTTFSVTAGKTTVRNVKLTTGAKVSGRVTGPAGEPVANASVGAKSGGKAVGALTDSNGRFLLVGLKTGTAIVSVTGGSDYWKSSTKVSVKVGATANHAVSLKRSSSIKGMVMNEMTGEPVQGALVTLNPNSKAAKTRTDAQGRYSFTGVQSRTNTVSASVRDVTPIPNLLDSRGNEVIVNSGRQSVADILMPQGGAVEGWVTDSSGQPFESGTVKTTITVYEYWEDTGEDNDLSSEAAAATANDDGTFRLERLSYPGSRSVLDIRYCPTFDGAVQCTTLTSIPITFRPNFTTGLAKFEVDPTFSRIAVTQIQGAAVVGQTLRAMPSSWYPKPVTRKYQWFRNGVAVEGATSRNYTLTSADRGARMSVEYTGSSPRFVTSSSLSAQTPKVAAAS